MRIVRIERGEQVAQLRPLTGGGEILPRLGSELLDGQGAAPVLEQELEARRGPESGDGRDVERKDDRLGDGGELLLQPGHDPPHVQRRPVALLPGLEADEDGAEVRLVGVCDEAEAADRREGIHARGRGNDLLDPREHRAGSLQRGPWWQLHVDAEKSLVLLGDEAGRQLAADQAGAQDDHAHQHDRQHGAPHQDARHADVATGDPVEHPVEPAEEGAERTAHRLGRLQQHRREGRGQRQRAEGREQHRDRDGERELLVHAAGEARHEGDRDEHRGQDQRDPDHGRGDLLHRLPGRRHRVEPVLDVVHHGLDDDDGVVHHDADGEHQPEHRQRVDGEAEEREEDERSDERNRHRQQRDERGPDILEEYEHHERHQDDRLDERLEDLVDGGLDRRRRVVDDLVVHVRREESPGAGHGVVDRLGRLELVGARQQVDGHRAGRLAVEPAEGVVVLRAELGPADVPDADLGARLRPPDDDVLELLGRDESARRGHRVRELLALRRRGHADPAGRGLEVLLLDGGNDVSRGQPELGQLVGSEPDPHAVVGAAEQIDLRDAGDAEELVAQVDAAVVDQVVGVVRPLRGVQRHDHQDARALLLDGHALGDRLRRQPRLGRVDAVLGEDVRLVLIDADREVHVEEHAAVAGVGRLHVDHRLDAVDLLLDGRRDRLLHRHRRGARVGRRDADRGRGQERVLLDAERGQDERPEQHDQDRDDDGDDRPPDEELGHGYAPAFAADLVTGFTCIPGRTFCTPSTITRSPGLRPDFTT